tara:strand:- start:10344 stop:10868 length:525 start_codon:yes stop_codon:yes gene_type:complete
MGNISETGLFEKMQKDSEDDYFADINDEEVVVATDENVEKILYSCESQARKIVTLEERRDASINFYNEEIEKVKDNLKYKHSILRSYLESNKQKTMKFPNGTISVRKSTKHVYSGSDEKLLKWCEKNDKNNEFGLVKKTKKPSKSAIIKFVKDTGFTPDDWDIVEKTSFKVKTQ